MPKFEQLSFNSEHGLHVHTPLFEKGSQMTDNENKANVEENGHVDANVADVQSETEAVEKTVADWEAELAELQGQLQDERLRSAAAVQNLTRRHQDEIQAAHKFASQKFATELLTVKDYLEMALLDQSQNFDALKMGVSMTLAELGKAFEKGQIEEINPAVGEKLDSHKHQAMQVVESEQEANTVVSVMKKGYSLSGRLLRPAMVVVAKAAE